MGTVGKTEPAVSVKLFEPQREKADNVDSDLVWHKPQSYGKATVLEMARDLKFCNQELQVLYYPISENNGADQLTAKLICVFVFA